MSHMNRVELPSEVWKERAYQHSLNVSPIADAFLKRRSLGLKDPVHDFLFTYYLCSPQKLKQWVPSFQEVLLVEDHCLQDYPWLKEQWFRCRENKLFLNLDLIPDHTKYITKFIHQLCCNIQQRAARYGCFGLHEWAMVYKASPDTIRHSGFKLRISPEAIKDFVDSQALCCTHYDAFRFFTPEARPLNMYTPAIETRLDLEQGGCVHANMDIYKWAVKLWPWIGSDFISKAFLLAVEGRELDMRASPYDLHEEGYPPICIETEDGRKEYQKEQQLYAQKAARLRDELKSICEDFKGH